MCALQFSPIHNEWKFQVSLGCPLRQCSQASKYVKFLGWLQAPVPMHLNTELASSNSGTCGLARFAFSGCPPVLSTTCEDLRGFLLVA